MSEEQERLKTTGWKKWGPYVSDRQWGTVREDYSADGDAWNYITHDMARSKAYRWGEEGIAGICDHNQNLCFAIALWNKKDPILKERYFGLSNAEGNHGEDVKELYYYLNNTPTHSYMKMLYKYPQQAFPYNQLVAENKKRGLNEPEYELMDTGIFNNDEYFDVFVEYAKQSTDDILIKITIHNRSKEAAALNVVPTLWFRNTWDWGYDSYTPQLSAPASNQIKIEHKEFGELWLSAEGTPELLFCNNETNTKRFNNFDGDKPFYKDGINDHILYGADTVDLAQKGTKAALNYDITIPARESVTIRLRMADAAANMFEDFDAIFTSRKQEADEFYTNLQLTEKNKDKAKIQRQAFAGMLWNKQFYYYDIHQWLNGDPKSPEPPVQRQHSRNSKWQHYNACDIISMPDKWEYPWFAAWDLA
ncbi:MAG: glucosidase, partial [Mucilaginibacter sp.]|nr:glucosidase [Mucilaginibacter sp.]